MSDSQTLYRKYRPKNFSEIIGQQHIVRTLSNAIKNNRIGQAYLFTGPRGTGKTSIARIFAKTINCEQLNSKTLSVTCEKCSACRLIEDKKTLDIIEIDAASNTGVDNIRELRETVALPPTALKYKAYIIDEVHMLSGGAFNALLKTLEEPPAHVVFILATTEIHKVPETIISRCQRFDFTRLPLQNIIEKLTLISQNEKIKIDQESLEMIAIASEGGMRDAESLLGQVISLEDKNITVKEVEEILGATDKKQVFEIAELLFANDSAGAIGRINQMLHDGFDLQVFTKSFVNYLRQIMLLKVSSELKSAFAYEVTSEQLEKMMTQAQKAPIEKIVLSINLFLEAQNKISSFILPQLPLEIAIIKTTQTLPQLTTQNSQLNNQKEKINSQEISDSNPPADEQNTKNLSFQAESATTDEAEESLPRQQTDRDSQKQILTYDVQKNWNKLLEEIKPYNHSLKALLSNCKIVSVENNVLTLATPYDFYKEKLNDRQNKLTVEDVFAKILGSKISLKAVTNKEAGIKDTPPIENDQPENQPGQQENLLDSALEIMGGKIVEE